MNCINYSPWHEYDSAAEWCARHKIKGAIGDPLPANLSCAAGNLINEDPDAFQQRVRDFAYGIAMEGVPEYA